jgi:putative colanic acid biosynthesis acetyltransferase WcaF
VKSSLSFKNRAARFLWGLVWRICFITSPRSCFVWRRWLLRCFGATIHGSARVYPSAKVWAPWNLEMQRNSVLGEFADCYNVALVRMEAGSIVSQYAHLCTASHDVSDPNFGLVTAPILLRPRSWVCSGAFVGMGVSLGEGAVAAARSVVVRDVAPWTIVGGNPAAFIKRRILRSATEGCLAS